MRPEAATWWQVPEHLKWAALTTLSSLGTTGHIFHVCLDYSLGMHPTWGATRMASDVGFPSGLSDANMDGTGSTPAKYLAYHK
jgi:hypothetical protein